MDYLHIARSWHTMGLNILPIGSQKNPLVPNWSKWQQQRQTENDIAQLFDQSGIEGFGCVMGGSGADIRCIDIDQCSNITVVHKILQAMGLPETYQWTAQSGSQNGYHIYFRSSEEMHGEPISGSDKGVVRGIPKNSNDVFDHLELRWKKCFTVLPPSLHPSGHRYRFLTDEELPQEPLAVLSYEQIQAGFFAVAQLKNGKIEETQLPQTRLVPLLELACSRIRQSHNGSRNNTLFSQACRVAEAVLKGLLEEQEARSQLYEAAIAVGLSKHEVPRTIQSAFDTVKKNAPHINQPNIEHEHKTPFWTTATEKEKRHTTIDWAALFEVLDMNGYGKYYFESDKQRSSFVQHVGKVVETCSDEHIRDFLNRYVSTYPFEVETDRKEVISQLRREKHLFTQNSLLNVKPQTFDFLKDTVEEAFFLFRNCWVRVRKDGIEAFAYADLPNYVWKENIKERDFTIIPEVEHSPNNVFLRFLHCVCTDRNTGEFHEQRFKALTTGIGYVLHEYKKQSVAKAVLLYDEPLNGEVAKAGSRSGRTGKSLLANAIKHTRTTHVITKPKIDVNGRFVFQNVTERTKVILMDDIAATFDFSVLFALITEGIEIEKKYQQARQLNYKECPKILITSNFPTNGSGDSYAARRHEVELCRYFSTAYTPLDEFGHELFDDWDADQWNEFDNVMLYCVQSYLRNGLQSYVSEHLNRQRIIGDTSEELVEYLDDVLPDLMESGEWIDKHKLYEDFTRESRQPMTMMQKDFTRQVKKYCSGFSIGYEESDTRNGGKRIKYFRFFASSVAHNGAAQQESLPIGQEQHRDCYQMPSNEENDSAELPGFLEVSETVCEQPKEATYVHAMSAPLLPEIDDNIDWLTDSQGRIGTATKEPALHQEPMFDDIFDAIAE